MSAYDFEKDGKIPEEPGMTDAATIAVGHEPEETCPAEAQGEDVTAYSPFMENLENLTKR